MTWALMLVGNDLLDDVRAQRGQPGSHRSVAAVDGITGRDDGLSFGGQAGQNQRDSRAQVVRDYLGPLEHTGSLYQGGISGYLYLRAEFVELARQRVAAVEDRLPDVAGAVGQRGQGHDRRLQVGREAGERAGDHVDRAQRPLAADLQDRAVGGELDAHLLQ